MLANIYLKNFDIDGIRRIIPLLTESAEKGVDTAQFALAKCFLLEEECVYNLPQAIKWLTLSAEQGNQFAQYSLGRLYLDGREDFSPDTRQAERWLTLSAEQGLSLIHISKPCQSFTPILIEILFLFSVRVRTLPM